MTWTGTRKGRAAVVVLAVLAVVTGVYRALVLGPLHYSPVDLTGQVALVTGVVVVVVLVVVLVVAEY